MALTTKRSDGDGQIHTVHLTDIRTSGNRETRTFTLNQTRISDQTLEIMSSSFSPDGMFLALARNDNEVHIYDIRKIPEAYLELKHERKRHTGPYGITGCSWVNGLIPGSLGLVTAGSDGTSLTKARH